MQLKTHYTDFIVDEQATHNPTQGTFSLCLLKKQGMTTLQAVHAIAKHVGVHTKYVGYAGLKDKFGITTQYISIKFGKKERITSFDHPYCSLTYLGQIPYPITLGNLQGNTFTITVRQLPKPLTPLSCMPNYFDEQRFSSNNIAIGLALLQHNFAYAVSLIQQEHNVQHYIQHHPNDYIGALRTLPVKQLMLYIGAVQALCFNQQLSEHCAQQPHRCVSASWGTLCIPTHPIYEDISFCLPGFDSPSLPLLTTHHITPRSFIMKSIPALATASVQRKAFVPIEALELGAYAQDTQQVSFFLPKGSYAT
ncbi:MAG: tRNA pseudouridine(13) synthase TruD, partial [Candidatus Woesearchaeota archaeon]